MNVSTATHCRACSGPFFPGALLTLEGMPSGAQKLPTATAPDEGIDLRVRQCEACGLVQIDAEPVPYYREVIRAADVSEEMRVFRSAQFRSWIDRHNLAGGKILECGCGAGEFLAIMGQSGVRAFGIEYGEDNVDKCRRRGLAVERGYFENDGPILSDALFDGFYSLNFLEHVPDLNGYLRGVAANLCEGAVGLVEVPNFDMILSCNTVSEFIRDHLYYFTMSSLTSLLERNGFEVTHQAVLWYGYILAIEVRRRGKIDLSAFISAKEMLAGQLRRLAEECGPSRIAVWGASHQAFTALAMARMGGRIRCIIDSAKFKQGHVSPATHIPIVPPDAVHEGDLDVLIVAAGGYSSEVVRLARKRFGEELRVIVLREDGLKEHKGHYDNA